MRTMPYTAREVAAMLGLTRDKFYRIREQMEREQGLPPSMTSAGHRRLYERARVDKWFAKWSRAALED